jgi:hypothetical protein
MLHYRHGPEGACAELVTRIAPTATIISPRIARFRRLTPQIRNPRSTSSIPASHRCDRNELGSHAAGICRPATRKCRHNAAHVVRLIVRPVLVFYDLTDLATASSTMKTSFSEVACVRSRPNWQRKTTVVLLVDVWKLARFRADSRAERITQLLASV